ncbi:CRTAC1 family protein [bacterium]|nr:CRTAC1 family protein [bacterium]MCI0602663.1 CRTAC1 family protein [bacterium]
MKTAWHGNISLNERQHLASGRLLLSLFLLSALTMNSSPFSIQFTNVAKQAGLKIVTYTGGLEKNHILESTGNGILVLDYDSDDDLDLYFVNAYRFPKRGQEEPHSNVLYRNDSSMKFTDVTSAAGVGAAVYGQGGCVGDIDNDGKPDMYVTNFGSDILYRNNGNGTFSDWTAKANLQDSRWSIGCTFFDADNDGDQDLYVANYIEASWKEVHEARRTRLWRGKVEVLDGPKGLPGSGNLFYLNNGKGVFTESTEKAGLKAGSAFYSMGVVSFDYDNDGDIDIYVANDSTPNCLYRNRGNGTFEEVATPGGVAYNANGQEQGSMGVDFGDYNNDGWFDLLVTNFANDYYTLYRNLGRGLFQDESFAAGIAVPTFVPLGWGSLFLDVDNDSDLDLFFSNGHIYPQVDQDKSLHETYRQKNQLFLNEKGKFKEITDHVGPDFQTLKSGRGAACVDLDNDGDLDIVISNQDAAPTLLENRSKTGNHWITFDIIDGTRLALGTLVKLKSGGITQMKQKSSGGSYASQNDMRLHFGLGNATTIDQLMIRWPDGKQESYAGLAAGHFYRITRGAKPQPVL